MMVLSVDVCVWNILYFFNCASLIQSTNTQKVG